MNIEVNFTGIGNYWLINRAEGADIDLGVCLTESELEIAVCRVLDQGDADWDGWELTRDSGDATLTPECWDYGIRVIDADGGVWYPGESALASIRAAEDQLGAALVICTFTPGAGVWKS